jgi:KEOPS complex subunit Cgi121
MIYRILGGISDIDDVESFIDEINQFAQIQGIHVQVLDAGMICGLNHMESAITHALRAYDEHRMATQTLEMEVLLYASGERQLTRAIPKMGVKKDSHSMVVSILSGNHSLYELDRIIRLFKEQFEFKEDSSVISVSIEKLKRWMIPDWFLKSLSPDEYEDVILEKVAYVDIIK